MDTYNERMRKLDEDMTKADFELMKLLEVKENVAFELSVEKAKETLLVSGLHLSEAEKRAKVFLKTQPIEDELLKCKFKIEAKQLELRTLARRLDNEKELLHYEMAKMKLI